MADDFPKIIKLEDLSKFGCKQIEGMTYYSLEKYNKKGIYEPDYIKGKIKNYTLRNVI
jgi:hypothetical protein